MVNSRVNHLVKLVQRALRLHCLRTSSTSFMTPAARAMRRTNSAEEFARLDHCLLPKLMNNRSLRQQRIYTVNDQVPCVSE